MMGNPHIVYLLADDLGIGDVSCYGAKKIHTPHMDQLAKEGMLFTDAHSPSAVCTPTRYSVLTGRYNWRSALKAGVLYGHSEPLIEEGRLTVPSFLQEHGYHTVCIGKWHLGLGWSIEDGVVDYKQPIERGPTTLGFDYFYGISASLDMPPYCFIENDQTVGIPSVEKYPKHFGQQGREGLMVTEWKDEEVNNTLTEKAIEVIEEHDDKQSNQPLFMYFALTGPHTPWEAREGFKGKSVIGERGDMILELDDTVGRMIDALKKKNMWDNTLFIVTSDNGPHPKTDEITVHDHAPAGPYKGQKADIWDGGHRVPFIASWPNVVEAGGETDELVCLTDLLQTCAHIIDQPLPKGNGGDSISMLPVLKGNTSERTEVIHHSISGMYAIRSGKWKLVLGQGSGGFHVFADKPQKIGIPTQGKEIVDGMPGQLYHMENDPQETNNVYVEHPEIVNALTAILIDTIKAAH